MKLLLMTLICSVWIPAITAQELPTWKSKSGSSTQAQFYSIDNSAKTLTLLIPKTIPIADLDPSSVELAKTMMQAQKSKIESSQIVQSERMIPFEVIGVESIKGKKVSFDVMVNLVGGKLPSKDQLGAISDGLVKKLPFERKFVGFYLPDMKIDNGYFATAHQNPKLDVRIQDFALPEKYRALPTAP